MNSDSVILSKSIEKSFSLRRLFYITIKRLFDIFVGILGMIIVIPLSIIIKIISICHKEHDSIFFKQQRIGKDGKLFTMYKFRTMVPNADNILIELMRNDATFREEYMVKKKVKNDPRITKVGRILRKSSLDEFPQFINIFLGQMSLVGNRPYLPREKEDMGIYYKDIVSSKPGLTGLWQTSGRSNTTFEDRLKMEQKYSKIRGLKLDIIIMFKTIIQVIKKDGAH
jgi:undecaprenyl-phosphate galactose phosphotransferase